jgi:hypothetical protein
MSDVMSYTTMGGGNGLSTYGGLSAVTYTNPLLRPTDGRIAVLLHEQGIPEMPFVGFC